MRIAQVAPLFETVPPVGYGGTERVVAGLCNELTRRGHEVVLFAAEASEVEAELEARGQALRGLLSLEQLVELAPHLHLLLLEEVRRREVEFDVVHAHLELWALPFAGCSPTPWLLTLHGRLDGDAAQEVLPRYPEVPLVSISDDQRRAVAGQALCWVGTVHNGLDLSAYAEEHGPRGEHLAFLGRFSPEKGPVQAIEVARRTGRRLEMAAKVDPTDRTYYEREVEPLLGDDTALVGEIGEDRKPEFLGRAAATLFPSDWPEPFGLVMIESMAAGTPVIALRRGSVPEVILDGQTGFICDDVDAMVEAVGRLHEIDPERCRRHAERFSVSAMTDGYERVYRSLVGDGRGPRAASPRRLVLDT